MRGDFSVWQFDKFDNFNGTLPQQGRVVLDRDGLAQTRIDLHWQKTAGQDIIGADTAAVPASEPNSFKIDQAQVVAGKVQLTVRPGHLWADGILAYLDGAVPVTRTATYLQPPVQSPAAVENTIDADTDTRDAVVLEVWREALSGFQIPEKLIEPALGGPDTAEYVHTACAFRLFRMQAGQNCENLPLDDDFSQKGKLTVSLQPTQVIAGDCPVVEGGGYTGFEHRLYRMEIAHVTTGGPMFKWSQFNGGLVGRGVFDRFNMTVDIRANLPAINTCGRTTFYLEAEEFDSNLGYWKVTYGAPVTLNNNQLTLPNAATFGLVPNSTNSVFFRLWDDIRNITDFPVQANPNELVDGIRLEFEANATGKYAPKDYWTFSVRAGGIGNQTVAIGGKDVLLNAGVVLNQRPPDGIHYHRVPLAELNWHATLNITPPSIEECREIFQPLTRLTGCCTYRVGDGTHSHGDFTSIKAAINALPASGGEICVLPGTYTDNVLIDGKHDIVVHGCGQRSKVVSAAPTGNAVASPVFRVHDSQRITIRSLAIEAHDTGVGVLLQGTRGNAGAAAGIDVAATSTLRRILLEELHITAATRSAIEVREGQYITIQRCRIAMKDTPGRWPGLFFVGDDSLIERNDIQVRTVRQATTTTEDTFFPAGSAIGGMQLGGTCMRVRIINNLIRGGIANGITLGSVKTVTISTGDPVGEDGGWVINIFDPCNPCLPGDIYIPPSGGGDTTTTRQISAGPLYDIRIERNRIWDMGLNGIGVVGFFDLSNSQEMISLERLAVLGNDIRRCLRRSLQAVPTNMVNSMGYGGITLADVTDFVAWDNVIEENGPDALEPICGIFVLHGEGIDITRNRIVDNGRTPTDTVDHAKIGRRGGINIVHAISPRIATKLSSTSFGYIKAVSAVRVHENTVAVPLGQALVLDALGAVSVVGNQFTSRGAVAFSVEQIASFASTVLIFDRGYPIELFGLFTYQSVAKGTTVFGTAEGRLALPNGNVLFSNNQCLLEMQARTPLVLSSVVIFTLDDLGFHNNQCLALLPVGRLLTQAILFGLSAQATDNRFEEPLSRTGLNTLFSAVTLGLQNITSQNQATHCLSIHGFKVVNAPNQITLELLSPGFCARAKILSNFAGGASL